MSRGGFWSRRKAGVEAEARDAEIARDAQARAAEEAALEAETAEKTDAEVLEELGLPDPDSLKLGDDVRAFMAKTVPDRIRRRALRQLWRTNPVLACLDGLNDYDDDYTDAATVVPNLKTAYQVGKGMLAHTQELARKQAEAEARDLAPDIEAETETLATAPQSEDTLAQAPAGDPPELSQAQAEADTSAPAGIDSWPEPDASSEPAPAPRRRMRFAHFDD